MVWIVLIVFIFLLIFLIGVIPFKIQLGAHLNILENKGFYLLKVAFIKLLCGRVRISGGKLEFENNNDLLFKQSADEEYVNKIFILIMKTINVNNISIFVQFGNSKNAANTAVVCGALQSALSAFYATLKTKYKNMYQFLDIDPNYNNDTLESTVSAEFSISVIQVLICLIKAKFEMKKESSNE